MSKDQNLDQDAEAWEEIEAAIAKFLNDTGEPGLLVDWALVHHKIQPGDDGGDIFTTGVAGAYKQPTYRALGLLQYASTALKANIIPDEED